MRAQWRRPARLRWFWKRCHANWRRRSHANCASPRSASAPARPATARFSSFTTFWDSRSASPRSLRASMPTWRESSRTPCANTARTCATADFHRTRSRITRRRQRESARLFSSRAEEPARFNSQTGAGGDAARDARAVRLQRLGQSRGDGSSVQAHRGKIRSADGLQLRIGPRHAGAYLRGRVDLAGALPGALPLLSARYGAIQGRSEPEGTLERARNTIARFRQRIDPGGSRPRNGIQDAGVWRVPQPALAIDAASRQSRVLPSRPGHHATAAARCPADPDGPHALLPRARHGCGRLDGTAHPFHVETIRTVAWMKGHARRARAGNRIVGLVPTMGALHAGHLSLIERAKRECSPVIASIFVNPKQFGANEDFAKYPRAFEIDMQKMEQSAVDSLFAPQESHIYPNRFSTYVAVDGLSERLEGRSRPGHFRGVATVVMKLLQIVQPNFAYFGRKDAQQSRIITQMARDLNLDTEIVVCPPVRDPDGLALSSRNVYLNADERKAATVLYRALDPARSELAVRVSYH